MVLLSFLTWVELPVLFPCRWCQFQPAQQHLRSLTLGILSELLGPTFTVDCQTNSLSVQHVRETFPSSFCTLRFFFTIFALCILRCVFFGRKSKCHVQSARSTQVSRGTCEMLSCRTSPRPQHPAVLTQKKRKKPVYQGQYHRSWSKHASRESRSHLL